MKDKTSLFLLTITLLMMIVTSCSSNSRLDNPTKVTHNFGYFHNRAMDEITKGNSPNKIDIFNSLLRKNTTKVTRTKSVSDRIMYVKRINDELLTNVIIAPLEGTGDVVEVSDNGFYNISGINSRCVYIVAPGYQSRFIDLNDNDTLVTMNPLSPIADDNVAALFSEVRRFDTQNTPYAHFISQVENSFYDSESKEDFLASMNTIRAQLYYETCLDNNDIENFMNILDIADSSATYWCDYCENSNSARPSAYGLLVSGTVYGSDGLPLPGVSVQEKGTSNGATSDIDGYYCLSVTNAYSTLEFSYLGYQTQVIKVDGRSNIPVLMSETSSMAASFWNDAKTIIASDICGGIVAGFFSVGTGILGGAINASAADCLAHLF